MGTKNQPGQFDCYANAQPDEPMFVLLGRDRHASQLVRLWALIRAKEGEEPTKVAEALVCADTMDAWQVRQGKSPYANDAAAWREPLFLELTRGMAEHPDGFDHPCDCNTCRSYAE